MADSLAPRSTLAASGIDPIQLNAQAMNSLSRAMRELRAHRTDYALARQQLAVATDAVEALSSIDTDTRH